MPIPTACKSQISHSISYLDEGGDPLDGHGADELGRDGVAGDHCVGVVVGADLAHPEERVGGGGGGGGGAEQVRVEPAQLRHDGLRRDVDAEVVPREEVVLDGRGAGHREVDAGSGRRGVGVGVGDGDGEVGREVGRQRQRLGQEVHHQAAVGVAVGGAVEEGGAVGRAGHVAERVGPRRRPRVPRVRERVAERVHRPERRRRGSSIAPRCMRRGRGHGEDDGGGGHDEEEATVVCGARHAYHSVRRATGVVPCPYILAS
jgi:hypothetical protein